MCFFCGCGGEGSFQSVKVIPPSAIKEAPKEKKAEPPSEPEKK
jgi:hypothetical protein